MAVLHPDVRRLTGLAGLYVLHNIVFTWSSVLNVYIIFPSYQLIFQPKPLP